MTKKINRITGLDAGPEIPHPAPMRYTELLIAHRLLTEEDWKEVEKVEETIKRNANGKKSD